MEGKSGLDAHEKGSSSEAFYDAEEQNEIHDATAKRSADGIILIPQPSDDPDDPLVRSRSFDVEWQVLIIVAELAGIEETPCACCVIVWVLGLLCHCHGDCCRNS